MLLFPTGVATTGESPLTPLNRSWKILWLSPTVKSNFPKASRQNSHVKAVGKFPAEYMPENDPQRRTKVEEALPQWDIGNYLLPNLITSVPLEVHQAQGNALRWVTWQWCVASG